MAAPARNSLNAVSAGPGAGTHWIEVANGVMLTAAIAAAAFALRSIPGLTGLSPMILAVLAGMAINALTQLAPRSRMGLAFVLRRVLRLAIMLLGLQLTTRQIADVGLAGLVVVVGTVIATFVFTVWLGRLLKVERGLSELLAAGTAICGASAIIATNTVTRAPGEDVAYAVASITLFGSIAMFAYPLLASALHLGPSAFGLWAGASIHEVAQAVAAAFQGGAGAGEIGTATKLTRVLLLAPLILLLGCTSASRSGGTRVGVSAQVPWFVLGFIALVVAGSIVTIPAPLKAGVGTLTSFLLAMSLAAMGLQTNLARLRDRGLRPLLLGFAASVFVAGFSLMLMLLMMYQSEP